MNDVEFQERLEDALFDQKNQLRYEYTKNLARLAEVARQAGYDHGYRDGVDSRRWFRRKAKP